jgi:hypothetical protein
MKLPDFIVASASNDYFIFYDKEEPYVDYGDRWAMLYDTPTLDDLFKKLRDKDFLNYKKIKGNMRGRSFFLYILKDRADLTETHKRLLKMYHTYQMKGMTVYTNKVKR